MHPNRESHALSERAARFVWRGAVGKLKAMRPQLGTMAPRLGTVPGDKRAVDRARDAAAPWRSWYKTKRWAELRLAVFVRDGFTCKRTGELVVGRYPAPNSAVANHKRPHRGDPTLFWDIDNLETVSKAVHDREIQKEEQSIPVGRWD